MYKQVSEFYCFPKQIKRDREQNALQNSKIAIHIYRNTCVVAHLFIYSYTIKVTNWIFIQFMSSSDISTSRCTSQCTFRGRSAAAAVAAAGGTPSLLLAAAAAVAAATATRSKRPVNSSHPSALGLLLQFFFSKFPYVQKRGNKSRLPSRPESTVIYGEDISSQRRLVTSNSQYIDC